MPSAPLSPSPRRLSALAGGLALALAIGGPGPALADGEWTVILQSGSRHGDWKMHSPWRSGHARWHDATRHAGSRDLLAESRERSRQSSSFDRVPIVPPFGSTGSARRFGPKILTLQRHDDAFDPERDVTVKRPGPAMDQPSRKATGRKATGPKIIIIRQHDGPFDPERDVIVLRP